MKKKQMNFLKCISVILLSFMIGITMLPAQTFAEESEKCTVELEGIKYLNGRDWTENETFTFVLKGVNGAPMPEEANGQDTYEFEVGRTDSKLNIGSFGVNIVYEEPGTYMYELAEKAGTASGVIYDTYVSQITVVVSRDDNGKLAVEKNVTARTDIAMEAGVSGFINQYKSKMTYPGLNIEKTLYGRDMESGEFAFTISCENPNSRQRGIAETDAGFKSNECSADETCVITGKLANLEFTQADNNKQFIYKISEELPEDDDKTQDGIQYQGVTYDEQQYWVVITPKDNGDGTMHTVTELFNDEYRLNDSLVASWDTAEGEIAKVSFVNEYKSDADDTNQSVTPEEPENTEQSGSKEVSPKTGDNSIYGLYFAILMLSCSVITFIKCGRRNN